MEDQEICIVAVQEHRRVHEEVIKYERLDNHLIVTSTARRNSVHAAVGGVGFILNGTAEKSLCEAVTFSNRIMRASFSGNPASTILSIYSPTNHTDNESETDRFYDLIHQEDSDSPPHNFLLM